MTRENKVRSRLESDEAVLGARSQTVSPLLVEVYGQLGYDFVWLDLEHTGSSPYDSTAFDVIVRAAESTDIELMVRVPHADPPLIHKVLDTGVSTLLIPRVETADEVRRAVKSSRFEFDGGPGDRGFGGGRPAGWGADSENFTEREDDKVVVGAMIESAAAVENIEDILAVPHLGFAFIGANDLSISLGHPQQKNHPEVVEAIERIEEACIAAGIPFGAPRHNTEAAAAALEDGYQVLRVGDEVGAVRDTLGDRIDALR